MIPAKFDYLARDLGGGGALGALSQSDDAKVIAGGQSLLPVLRMRLNAPDLLVDIGGIDTLKEIRDDGDAILIGAMAPYYEILANDSVKNSLGLLHKAITEVADPQIRHRGTLGGALVHADPAGDCGAPILALDAELVIAGQGGERTVAAADFFEDLFATAVGEDELLTHIRVPKYDGWGSNYEKFVRVAHQWPIVAVAAAVKVYGGAISEARIGLVNMGSTALRATATEQALVGVEATADGVRRGVRPGRRGHQPAVGPQRRRRLPQAPRDGADPPRGAGRDRRLIPWSSGTSSPFPPASRRPGTPSTTSSPWRPASRAPRSPRSRATPSRARARSSSARSRSSTTAPARSWRRTSRRAGW